jgi:superfamily II DNA helicase RecQ
MDYLVGSSGALLASVRRAAAGSPEAAARWARWTLTLETPPAPGGFARALAWRILSRGALVPPEPDFERALRVNFGDRAGEAALAAHRLQAAWLLGDPSGISSNVDVDLARTGGFTSGESSWLAGASHQDLARLLRDLRRLYPEEGVVEPGPAFVSWTGARKPGRPAVWIGEAVEDGAEILRLRAAPPAFCRDDAALESLARRLLFVPGLRPGQADGVSALLGGRDLSLRMPTGGGKSLVFQLAALLSPGTALIIAPLRALLRDQHRRLAQLGIGRAALLAGDDAEATRRGLAQLGAGDLIAALAAPERLDMGSFRKALRGAAETTGVSFVALDEAQCAARRGPDWRPSYRVLGARLRQWACIEGSAPALGAFSGSASTAAIAEAEKVLELRNPIRAEFSSARPNLSFHVWRGKEGDHAARLKELLTRKISGGRFGPGIIFCPRVEGPLGAAAVSEELAWSEGIDAAPFTGRAPGGVDPAAWTVRKRRAAEDFLAGRRGLLCATRAFGLGVDRPDVRFVVHLGLAASREEYDQQAGRAGRDGKPAECWMIVQCLSERRARRWARLGLEALRAEIAGLRPAQRDDVSRAYGMHLASFPGEAAERRDVELALWSLGDLACCAKATVEFQNQDSEALTRALVRLESSGVIKMEARFAGGWVVEKCGGWTGDSALRAAAEGIARDYSTIEPARRKSLADLVELGLAVPER